jgi:multiple sugar transport system permease protein
VERRRRRFPPGAAAILVAVPIVFVFNLFLDRFISGFTMGAVKG